MEIGNYYYEKLKFSNNIQILPPFNSFSKNIYWVVGILIKNKKMTALNLSKKLLKFGIETRPFFWPMHQQSIFKKLKLFKNQNYPNSTYLSKYGLYVPSYFLLKKKEINKISNIINKILR